MDKVKKMFFYWSSTVKLVLENKMKINIRKQILKLR